MDENSNLNLAKILDIARRYRDIIIATFIVVLFCSFYLALTLPNIYRSSSVILFTPQALPKSYIEYFGKIEGRRIIHNNQLAVGSWQQAGRSKNSVECKVLSKKRKATTDH